MKLSKEFEIRTHIGTSEVLLGGAKNLDDIARALQQTNLAIAYLLDSIRQEKRDSTDKLMVGIVNAPSDFAHQ